MEKKNEYYYMRWRSVAAVLLDRLMNNNIFGYFNVEIYRYAYELTSASARARFF